MQTGSPTTVVFDRLDCEVHSFASCHPDDARGKTLAQSILGVRIASDSKSLDGFDTSIQHQIFP